MERSDLLANDGEKVAKRGEYRIYRIPLNLSKSELSRYAELAILAGCRPKLQKLFKTSKKSGREIVDQKGIQKFIREHAMPEYEAHAWEREQKRVAAMRKLQEAEDELKSIGSKYPKSL